MSLITPLQRAVTKTIERASDTEVEIGTDLSRPRHDSSVVGTDLSRPHHNTPVVGTDLSRPFRQSTTNEDVINRSLPQMYNRTSQLGWLPLLTLLCAIALCITAYAFTDARSGGSGINTLFLPALVVMFAPIAIRLLLPTTSRIERICLLCVIGIACYLVKVLANPTYFTFYDEFLHWRTADDIARSGHLFTMNALLPVSPYYSGLEIITNALSTMSGLSTFYAGLVVIGMARLLMVMALFALNEQLLSSARVASLATLLYMVNPHFLLFDAQYGYESLALPLATLMLFALSPHQPFSVRLTRLEPLALLVKFSKTGRDGLQQNLRWITLTAWLLLIAIVFTHHVTDFFFDALLIVWTVIYIGKRLTPLYRSTLALTTMLALGISVASVLQGNNPVVGYLTSFMSIAVGELGNILSGTGSAKQLFVNYSGPPTPLWERLLTISSLGLIVASLPFGLLCLWKRYRANALVCTLGVFSLLYPVSQAFRLTNSGSEVADRAAAFLFIPIASVLAVYIVQFWPIARLRWFHVALLTGAMSLVFIGGVVLGAGPASALLPGPYEVIADSRSIEPQGIQAALWTRAYLQPDNRVAADRINQILLGTYGDQRVVTSIEDNIDLSPVFLSASMNDEDRALLRQANVHYLLADMRLTRLLPLLGYYYEMNETDAFHRKAPIDAQAFAKFNTSPQANRIYDGGDIVVYDMGGLSHASEK